MNELKRTTTILRCAQIGHSIHLPAAYVKMAKIKAGDRMLETIRVDGALIIRKTESKEDHTHPVIKHGANTFRAYIRTDWIKSLDLIPGSIIRVDIMGTGKASRIVLDSYLPRT